MEVRDENRKLRMRAMNVKVPNGCETFNRINGHGLSGPTPVIKTNQNENFRLEVSAYGPMLCVARVFVRGRERPVELERYINFESLD